MDSRFKIVFSGELREGTRVEDAIERLVSRFGVALPKARNLILDGRRQVLKRDLDANAAERYRTALEHAGLVVHVEPVESPAETTSLDTHEDDGAREEELTMRCPACGSERLENGICLDCGTEQDADVKRHSRAARGRVQDSDPSWGAREDPDGGPLADMGQRPSRGQFHDPRKVPTGHGLSWVVRGFWHFKTAVLAWLLIAAAFIGISIVVGMIPYVGGLVTSILSTVLIGGVMYGAREQDQGRQIRIEHLFTGFSSGSGQLLLVGVLYVTGVIVIAMLVGMIVGAAMVPMASSLDPAVLETQDPEVVFETMGPTLLVALLVASLLFIPLLMAALFAPALVALDGLTATEAMKQSFLGCRKNPLALLIYGLIGLVLIMLGSLPFGLGLFVIWPILMAAVYVAYRDIFYG